MNHSFCVLGLTRDVCFGSRASPIISVPDPSFSVLGLGSYVPCKISVSGLRSWVPPLGSQVSGPRSHLPVGSRVSGLGSHLHGPESQILGLTHKMGPGSRVLNLTKSPGSQAPLFGYAFEIYEQILETAVRRCSSK